MMETQASQEVTTWLIVDARPKEKTEPAWMEEVHHERQVQDGLLVTNVLEFRSVSDSPLVQPCSSLAPGGV